MVATSGLLHPLKTLNGWQRKSSERDQGWIKRGGDRTPWLAKMYIKNCRTHKFLKTKFNFSVEVEKTNKKYVKNYFYVSTNILTRKKPKFYEIILLLLKIKTLIITVNLGDDDAANDNDDIHLSSQVRWKNIKSNMKLNVVHISTWHDTWTSLKLSRNSS